MGDEVPTETESAFPAGHFYSPVVNPADVERRRHRIWPESPTVHGIDFGETSHRRVLTEIFPRFIGDYDYPDEAPAGDGETTGFFSGNSAFGWLDSRALFVLLRHWQPRRLIEVGGGYSSLLIADVNQRFLSGSLAITTIEPYPPTFLQRGLDGGELLEERVEDVPTKVFERLESGDVLFIDSSHVAKTGSDVNFLIFEILPRLAPGVKIHVHDIFLPHDYPASWVLEENRSWNEQYMVRALLMYSRAFRVVFGCSYAAHRFPDLVAEALADGRVLGGGSLWIERVDET
ncbi:MAG: class I SAM-dependent methyltransferase [Thermoanaerobaculia bacterium]|nr:class I SAM-dependent methyltransferase [Thermoanaerobaculia bacterium]